MMINVRLMVINVDTQNIVFLNINPHQSDINLPLITRAVLTSTQLDYFLRGFQPCALSSNS